MSNIYGSYTGSAQNISNTNSADIAYAELESQIVALDVRVTENDTDITYNESRIDTLEAEMDEVQAVTSIFTPDTPSIGTTTVETNLNMGYLTLTGVGQVDWRAAGQAGRVYAYINPGANNEFLLANSLSNGSSQSSFFTLYTRNIVTAVLKPFQIYDNTVNFFARSITNCSTIDMINADLTAVKAKTDLFALNTPVAGTTRISTSFDLNYKNITNVGTLQTTSPSVGGQVRSYISGTDGDFTLANELSGSDTFISLVTRSIEGVLSYFRVRNTTVDFNSRTISNCPTTTTMGTNITINSNAISAIQAVNATQTTAINALDSRVTSTEATNSTQNTRLTAVESVNASQTTAITNLQNNIWSPLNQANGTLANVTNGADSIWVKPNATLSGGSVGLATIVSGGIRLLNTGIHRLVFKWKHVEPTSGLGGGGLITEFWCRLIQPGTIVPIYKFIDHTNLIKISTGGYASDGNSAYGTLTRPIIEISTGNESDWRSVHMVKSDADGVPMHNLFWTEVILKHNVANNDTYFMEFYASRFFGLANGVFTIEYLSAI